MSQLADFLVADAAALLVILLEPWPGRARPARAGTTASASLVLFSLSVGSISRNLIRCFGECSVWFTSSLATQLGENKYACFFVINWCFKPFLRKKNLNQSYAHPGKLTLVLFSTTHSSGPRCENTYIITVRFPVLLRFILIVSQKRMASMYD